MTWEKTPENGPAHPASASDDPRHAEASASGRRDDILNADTFNLMEDAPAHLSDATRESIDDSPDGPSVFDLDVHTMFTPDPPVSGGPYEPGTVFAPGGDLDAVDPDGPMIRPLTRPRGGATHRAVSASSPDNAGPGPAAFPDEESLREDPTEELVADPDGDEMVSVVPEDLLAVLDDDETSSFLDGTDDDPDPDEDPTLDLAILVEDLDAAPDDPDDTMPLELSSPAGPAETDLLLDGGAKEGTDEDDVFELDPHTLVAPPELGGPGELTPAATPFDDEFPNEDDILDLDPVTLIAPAASIAVPPSIPTMAVLVAGEDEGDDDIMELDARTLLMPSGSDAGAYTGLPPGGFLDLLENGDTEAGPGDLDADMAPLDMGILEGLSALPGEDSDSLGLSGDADNGNAIGFLDILAAPAFARETEDGPTAGTPRSLPDSRDTPARPRPKASERIDIADVREDRAPAPKTIPNPTCEGAADTGGKTPVPTNPVEPASRRMPARKPISGADAPSMDGVAFSLTPEQMEAALERVVDKIFTEKIEKVLREVIERAVAAEIRKFGGALLDGLGDDA